MHKNWLLLLAIWRVSMALDISRRYLCPAQLLKDLSCSIKLSAQENTFITQTTVAQYWHDTFSLATLILMERYKINLHDKLSDLSHRTGI